MKPGGKAAASARGAGYRCGECGWTTAKWVGRCGEGQAWGTVDEVGAPRLRQVAPGPVTSPAVPIGEVDIAAARARPTGVAELDRVLGGGLVPGAVVLLAGEPGVGKSTLLLEAAARAAAPDHRVLYVTGEESAAQVRLRAERVGALVDELFLAAETDLAAVLGHVEAVTPAVLVLDSVQTIGSPDVDGQPGGVTQVREVAGALIAVAKSRSIATILVGHVTKDGTIAGPRTLEHLVDVVLSVEGDRHGRLRLVRALKNRYGPADEVGCFELGDDGMVEVTDPSGLFITRRSEPVPGTCVTVTLEGSRPLLAEVQALVAPTVGGGSGRRATSGLDASRVAMVLAVLERRAAVTGLGAADTYVATVGGVPMVGPGLRVATVADSAAVPAVAAVALPVAGSTSLRPLSFAPSGLFAALPGGRPADVPAAAPSPAAAAGATASGPLVLAPASAAPLTPVGP